MINWNAVEIVPSKEDEALAEAKIKAKAYLTETDWYIIRNLETALPVPPEVKTKRAEARKVLNS